MSARTKTHILLVLENAFKNVLNVSAILFWSCVGCNAKDSDRTLGISEMNRPECDQLGKFLWFGCHNWGYYYCTISALTSDLQLTTKSGNAR